MLIWHFKRFNVRVFSKHMVFVNAFIFTGLFSCFFLPFMLHDFADANEPSGRILKLEDAYLLALESNERIMISEKEITKSRLLPRKALSVMMPVLSAEGKFVESNESNEFATIVFRPKNQLHATFVMTQPVYRANYFPLKKQADVAVALSKDAYCQTAQNILLKTARLYYDILKEQALYKHTMEIKNLTEEELMVSKVKFDAGAVTEDVVLNAELNISRAEAKLIEHKNNLELARDMLWNLIGVEAQEYNLVEPVPKTTPIEDDNFLISKVFENRHDYKIAVLNLQFAKYDKDLVKSGFHPTLEGGWYYDRSDEDTFNRDKELWMASVVFKVPIFEGGLRFWELKEKHTNIAQAELALQDVKSTITTEVQDVFLSVKTYHSILSNLKKRLELAQKKYEIIFSKFKFGSATSTELNEALMTLESVKTELITKTYDYQYEILKLEKALGIFAQDYIKQAS
jgi:outer membrane protein